MVISNGIRHLGDCEGGARPSLVLIEFPQKFHVHPHIFFYLLTYSLSILAGAPLAQSRSITNASLTGGLFACPLAGNDKNCREIGNEFMGAKKYNRTSSYFVYIDSFL